MFKHRYFFFLFLLLFSVSCAWAEAIPARENTLPQSSSQFTRMDKIFVSQGDKLKAWLYLPAGISKPPVVVMAHGFGGQRWMRLPAYAEHFAQKGMAVFVFDYRGSTTARASPATM